MTLLFFKHFRQGLQYLWASPKRSPIRIRCWAKSLQQPEGVSPSMFPHKWAFSFHFLKVQFLQLWLLKIENATPKYVGQPIFLACAKTPSLTAQSLNHRSINWFTHPLTHTRYGFNSHLPKKQTHSHLLQFTVSFFLQQSPPYLSLTHPYITTNSSHLAIQPC